MTKRITESAEIDSFREAAGNFCRLVETVTDHSIRESCVSLFAVLHLLSYGALYLPDLSASAAFRNNFPRSSWERLYKNLCAYFGHYDVYWEVFDSHNHDHPEAVNGLLADDFSGIYRDIYPGLQAWETANAAERRSIVWQWRFQYCFHWGQHATSAIRALHSLIFLHDVGGEEDDVKELHPTKPSNATSEPASDAGSSLV